MTQRADGELALEVQNIEVVYSRVITAIQGVSLEMRQGSMVGLVGVNGAGKTTTLRAISGFLNTEQATIKSGSINLYGDDITGLEPHRAAEKGVMLIPERDKVFDLMTVDENLRLAATEDVDINVVFEYFPSLLERRNHLARVLSGGEKQMLALASGFLAQPSLLLVDEVSLGLAPAITKTVITQLKRMHAEHDLNVLIVDQNVELVLESVDFGYVMESGRVVFSGTREELLDHGDIREFYLGAGSASDSGSYRNIKQYRRTRRWW